MLINVTPKDGPESDEAAALVKRLRAPDGPATALPGVAVNVGGAAAQNHDFSDLISGSLWKILLFVLVFSYIVLLIVLRSVLLPLKAVIMNVLSVGRRLRRARDGLPVRLDRQHHRLRPPRLRQRR